MPRRTPPEGPRRPPRRRIRFIEPRPRSIDELAGLTLSDPFRFRKRLRLNRALAVAAGASPSRQAIEMERILGDNDLLPFYVLELGATLGRAVCKLGFDDERDGTGFLIGPDLLVTNNHVLPNADRAREARCIFDFQLNTERKPQETVMYRLDPDALFLTSWDLDYSFVRIDPAAGVRYRPIPASRGSFTTLEKEWAHIVQHPGGRMKRVALRENRIVSDSGVSIHYLADTNEGSSGSPVFNNDWQLIGLHHAAQVEEVPDPANPSQTTLLYTNEAIKFSAIAADLERQAQESGGGAAREILRAFGGTDSLLGYFGALGRPASGSTALKRVFEAYSGEAHDVDVGYWQVGGAADRHEDKVPRLAKLIADLQLDLYALAGYPCEAAEYLVGYMADEYGLCLRCSAEPQDKVHDNPVSILWNELTLELIASDWPDRVKPWFNVGTGDFEQLKGEPDQGKLFANYPERLHFRARGREELGRPFEFNFVPLVVRGATTGLRRRALAVRILSAAIAETMKDAGPADWIVGGTFCAVAIQEALDPTSSFALAAAGPEDGADAVLCLRSPGSPIERIFISPNLSRIAGDIDLSSPAADVHTLAAAAELPAARPLMLRLTLATHDAAMSAASELPAGLKEALELVRH